MPWCSQPHQGDAAAVAGGCSSQVKALLPSLDSPVVFILACARTGSLWRRRYGLSAEQIAEAEVQYAQLISAARQAGWLDQIDDKLTGVASGNS